MWAMLTPAMSICKTLCVTVAAPLSPSVTCSLATASLLAWTLAGFYANRPSGATQRNPGISQGSDRTGVHVLARVARLSTVGGQLGRNRLQRSSVLHHDTWLSVRLLLCAWITSRPRKAYRWIETEGWDHWLPRRSVARQRHVDREVAAQVGAVSHRRSPNRSCPLPAKPRSHWIYLGTDGRPEKAECHFRRVQPIHSFARTDATGDEVDSVSSRSSDRECVINYKNWAIPRKCTLSRAAATISIDYLIDTLE